MGDEDTPFLSPEQIEEFHERGYLVVRGLVKPSELADAQCMFDKFMNRELEVQGKDYGMHTPGLLNVTAFSLYHALVTLGVIARVEARCAAVTQQLWAGRGTGAPLALDYEQLLRKLPASPGCVFPPHQDMHYWPKSRSGAFDTRTTTCSVAINDADAENGCLWVLPGTHKSQSLYPGCVSKLAGSRPEAGGVIVLEVLPEDEGRKVDVRLGAGDASFHEEWVVHGSEANASPTRSRDTLIFAYRAESMIAVERELGFRHSYNDAEEVLRNVRETIFP